ncbi:MAG: relaxase/mobilization nuclease domain-containing protein [Cytophagales bacterium]|jgi:hypothetical protein|nr:relaxase/mobilization nuclease domain-containing protein [Cytophagales bacterium]
MVAVIRTNASVHRVVNYNENKVRQGAACCIGVGNYPVDAEKLSVNQRLNGLLKQLALNPQVKNGAVHISLNFDPSEKLPAGDLARIAETYMQKIGFGGQPYLVYEHHDAGHPHIHIVTVKVRADGSRIDMHGIGRNRSEKARKEIEESFGLAKAQGSRKREERQPEPVGAQRVQYGKTGTKEAIGKVLGFVLKNYRYASLPELNAVLGQYNVLADCGSEKSRTRRYRGLAYQALDGQGNKTGVPIKASDFSGRPTLAFVESRFTANAILRQPHKQRVKGAVDRAFLNRDSLGLPDLKAALEKQGIRVLIRQNQNGIIHGITYVDHLTKCVFNGSALGKPYSAKGILERCDQKAKSVSENILVLPISQQDGGRPSVRPGHRNADETHDSAAGVAAQKEGVNPRVYWVY